MTPEQRRDCAINASRIHADKTRGTTRTQEEIAAIKQGMEKSEKWQENVTRRQEGAAPCTCGRQEKHARSCPWYMRERKRKNKSEKVSETP